MIYGTLVAIAWILKVLANKLKIYNLINEGNEKN